MYPSQREQLESFRRALTNELARRPYNCHPSYKSVRQAILENKIAGCEKAIARKGHKEGNNNPRKAEKKAARRAARNALK